MIPFIPLLKKPRKRRRSRRPQVPSTGPPPTPDQIIAVVLGPGPNAVTATISGDGVASIDDPPSAMWIYLYDADPASAATADASDPNHVVFTFDVDVSSEAMSWHVENPDVYEMVDGGALVEPYDGAM